MTEQYTELTKTLVKSISACLDFKFTYAYKDGHHTLMSKERNKYDCSIHAFEEAHAFYFSIRSFNVEIQKKILTALDEKYPLDMTLYQSTLMQLSNLYTSLSFAVKPLETDKADNLTWSSYCKTKRTTETKCWTNFDELHYCVNLYPWKKNILHLTVSQKIKMIVIEHEGAHKYIPVLETSLPLNDIKRTKICISLDKEIPNIYLFKNDSYKIETIDKILNNVNKSIRYYSFNIMNRNYKTAISKTELTELSVDDFLKYVALHEMIEI